MNTPLSGYFLLVLLNISLDANAFFPLLCPSPLCQELIDGIKEQTTTVRMKSNYGVPHNISLLPTF